MNGSRVSDLCQNCARSDGEVQPPYGSKYSKHTFTQPQLMAILCLMRFEDWTFREAEVRLAEHSDLRWALGLDRGGARRGARRRRHTADAAPPRAQAEEGHRCC